MTPHEILSAFRNDGSHERTLLALFAEVERLRGALEAISAADAVELALDPEWPRRIARQALQRDTHD